VAPPEILTQQTPAGALSLTIPVVELETYTQLGILITRLDAHEHLDSVGAYTLVLSPTR
jgi:hypothetical protein